MGSRGEATRTPSRVICPRMSVVKGAYPFTSTDRVLVDSAANKISSRPIRHFVAIRTLGGGRVGLSAVRSGNAKTFQHRGLPLGIVLFGWSRRPAV